MTPLPKTCRLSIRLWAALLFTLTAGTVQARAARPAAAIQSSAYVDDGVQADVPTTPLAVSDDVRLSYCEELPDHDGDQEEEPKDSLTDAQGAFEVLPRRWTERGTFVPGLPQVPQAFVSVGLPRGPPASKR